jgi:hypothetical protein
MVSDMKMQDDEQTSWLESLENQTEPHWLSNPRKGRGGTLKLRIQSPRSIATLLAMLAAFLHLNGH